MLKSHEKSAIKILVRTGIDQHLLEQVLDSRDCTVEHTGAGYFIEVRNEKLPLSRCVYTEPSIVGTDGNTETGYIVFVENRSLTLECHLYAGDRLDRHYRDRDISLSETD